MNIDTLVGNAVLFFSVVYLNMVDQLSDHALCNGGRVGVPPYLFKKIVNVHALALVLFQFQPQSLDLLCVFSLLLFVAFGHFGKPGIVDLSRYIVLIEPFKEHIQLPVTGGQSVQLPLLADASIFRHLCRVSDHDFDKVIFVFAGKAGQPLDLIQNDLLQEVQPDIVRLAALAIAGVVVLTTEKLDVVVVLVEVEIEIAAALRAF